MDEAAILDSGTRPFDSVRLKNGLLVPPTSADLTIAALAAGTRIVSIVDAGPMVVLTLCGLKAQFAPVGRPEHVNPTACLNPFWGVTVSVIVPDEPAPTAMPELFIEKEKSAAGTAATVTIVAAELDAL